MLLTIVMDGSICRSRWHFARAFREENMGLLDILNGIQAGPGGQRPSGTTSGGMSPMTIAILALLAQQAFKTFAGSQGGPRPAEARPGAGPMSPAGGGAIPGMPGGGLGDLLKGGLGGLLGGAAGGSVLSGGLNDLLKQLQQSGQGDVANSWVGKGPNKAIAPDDLANALGANRINSLMGYSGMSREELLGGLSQNLPDVVDQLTPEGRLPTEQEAARLI
jgi:uncharacterized protein YidB (DUF937 family)